MGDQSPPIFGNHGVIFQHGNGNVPKLRNFASEIFRKLATDIFWDDHILWIKLNFSNLQIGCTNDATKHKGNTLPETNTSHLKIGLPNRKVVFQPSIFRGYVSFREGKLPKPSPIPSSDVLHPVSMVSHKLWIEKPYAKNLESDPPPMRIKGHSIHFFVVKIRKFSVGQWTLSEVAICVHFPSKPVPTSGHQLSVTTSKFESQV